MLKLTKSNLLLLRDNMAKRNQLAQQLDQTSVVENIADIQIVKDSTDENSDIITKCDTIIAKIKIKKSEEG